MLAFRKPEPTMMKASAAQNTLIVGSVCPPVPSTAIRPWPDREQQAAEQHRLALAELAVGEIAAEHRGDVDQRAVGAVDQRRPCHRRTASAWSGRRPAVRACRSRRSAPTSRRRTARTGPWVAGEFLAACAMAIRPPIARTAKRRNRGDRGDPVALVPQGHVLHACIPVLLLCDSARRGAGRRRRTLTGKSRL